MKLSGQHKHNKSNLEGKHVHDFDELGEQGVKILVKGSLKNMPEFSFKKAKTNKQKNEAKEKRDEKKQEKKKELNELIQSIEKNFEKFQGTKQIAQQQVAQQIPVYIPQYTPPTGNNLTVENLTEINNMILSKENELKQYYEQEYQQKWDEIEQAYTELENRALEEDREIAFKEPVMPQIEQPLSEPDLALPVIRPVPLPLPPQYTPPTLPPPPTVIDDFELIPKPTELTPSEEFEYEPEQKSFADNVVDLLGIFDDEVLNKYKNMNPKLKVLEEINEEQNKLIKSKQNQLNQLNETIELMEQSVNLSKNDIDKLENELLNKIEEIKGLTDENEKLQKMKEAEILSLQLNSAEDVNDLKEQLKVVKEEKLQTEQELINLKLLNTKINEEDLEDINISPAEEQLINYDLENDVKAQFLRQYLPIKLIPKQKNKLDNLYETMNRRLNSIGDNELRNEITSFLNQNSMFITQKDLIEQLKNNQLSLEEKFNNEEQLQRQIITERVAEAEEEEVVEIINQIDENLVKIQNQYNELQTKRKERQNEIKKFDEGLNEIIDEYESLISTLDSSLKNAGINDIDEIDEIDNEDEKNNLLALNSYIEEQKETLEREIGDIHETLFEMQRELNELEIELIEKEKEMKNTQQRSVITKQKLGLK